MLAHKKVFTTTETTHFLPISMVAAFLRVPCISSSSVSASSAALEYQILVFDPIQADFLFQRERESVERRHHNRGCRRRNEHAHKNGRRGRGMAPAAAFSSPHSTHICLSLCLSDIMHIRMSKSVTRVLLPGPEINSWGQGRAHLPLASPPHTAQSQHFLLEFLQRNVHFARKKANLHLHSVCLQRALAYSYCDRFVSPNSIHFYELHANQ